VTVLARAEREEAGPRERLVEGLAESIEQKGYRASTVADIVRIARTSRRTFYEHFDDRDACFLALFEQTNEATMETLASAVDAQDPPERQVERAIDAYLAAVTARPALQLSFVRELPALGAAGAERQRAVIERFAELLVALVEAGRRAHPELAARPLPADMAIMIVGGVRELMVVSAQRGRDVRELRRSVAEAVRAILNATVL
jgi:AcrR family transcriptional regulator